MLGSIILALTTTEETKDSLERGFILLNYNGPDFPHKKNKLQITA